jgi:hypothetical protein
MRIALLCSVLFAAGCHLLMPYSPGSDDGSPREGGVADGACESILADVPPPPPDLDPGCPDIDCNNPMCQAAGYTCIPAAPSGWDGYFELREYPYKTTPPVCGVRYVVGPNEPAQCTTCTCGGGSCKPPQVMCWETDATCNGSNSVDWTSTFANSSCTSHTKNGNAMLSCKVTQETSPDVATCTVTGGTLTQPDPWSTQVDACPQTVGVVGSNGCKAGAVCVKKKAGLCVRKDGAANCTSEWSVKHTVWKNGIDGRGCSVCTCNITGVCAASIFVYSAAGCSTTPLPLNAVCKNLSPFVNWSTKTLLTGTKVNCTPTTVTATPTGVIQKEGETTFCCRS